MEMRDERREGTAVRDGHAIPWARPFLGGNESLYVQRALASTWISGGEFIDRFEREFAAFTGARHAVTVSSGTAALHLAYLGLGIGEGDEVLMPALTFAGCAAMVLASGATPRFADCDPDTMGISAESVRKAILWRRPKAVLAVHLFGNSCDLDPLIDVGRELGVQLIEDAAESVGTRYGGRHVGTFGAVGCFSFQATKTLTMGEGGMLVTDDDELAAKLRVLRNHGFRPGTHYWHDVVGFNYRLTNLQAAVGCAQLERIDEILACRARVAREYADRLGRIRGVRVPAVPPKAELALWMQPIILDPGLFPRGREWVRDALRQKGIETRPLFYPVYQLPPYREFASACPVAEEISAWGLTLPVHETLTTDEIDLICRSLADLVAA